MSDGWAGPLAGWWRSEIADDDAYRTEVLPLLLDIVEPLGSGPILDVGCGEGWIAEILSDRVSVVGCDLSEDLARSAAARVPTVVGRLPELRWLGDDTVAGAVAVLVLEHLDGLDTLLTELARVVRPGGFLATVLNHPVFTAPGSGPVIDPDDGEALWRTGSYLETGHTDEPAGDHRVRFHHRPFGSLLSGAATAGWSLQRLVETGVGAERAAADPLLGVQANVPRLAAIRWSLDGTSG